MSSRDYMIGLSAYSTSSAQQCILEVNHICILYCGGHWVCEDDKDSIPNLQDTAVFQKIQSYSQSISIDHGKCRDLCDTQDILGTQRKEMELCPGLAERRTDLLSRQRRRS